MNKFNQPRIVDEKNEGKIPRWVHQPLTIDYFGTHCQIKENGKVIISKVADEQPDKDDVQYDEIEIPAGLIFKLAGLLKDTRTQKYVTREELDKEMEEEGA